MGVDGWRRRIAQDLVRPGRALEHLRQGIRYARILFREAITPEAAIAAIQKRLADREGEFLRMLELSVYAAPASPYRPLLHAAGYDLPQVRVLVERHGLEAALQRLRDDGVYVAIEELKGTREARRGAQTFRFAEQDFRNPLIGSGLVALSGGTRSRGIMTTIPSTNHRMGAEHLALALRAYGLDGAPMVVWLTQAHGASQWAILALATMGRRPLYWCTYLPRRLGAVDRAPVHTLAMRTWARLRGIALPHPRYVPFDQASVILGILRADPRRPCGVITTPSSALRLALAARSEGIDLGNVVFITIGEPLTPAKLGAVHAVGARAFSSLGFTEFGRATYGCAIPSSPDDTHVCRDAVAVIQRRRPVDAQGGEVDALLFTSLRRDSRRILLNVETGDYAKAGTRRCGCLLESVGWTEHLEGIRSFEKLNAEGRRFSGSELITLIEEILPARFGGDPTDFQLLEQEDEDGFTRLYILVHPRLGPVDEDAVLRCVNETLRPAQTVGSNVWTTAGTIQVRRAPPRLTGAGKLMPLHHLGGVPSI